VLYLDLAHLCVLRLVSRTLSTQLSGRSFQKLFETRTLTLNEQNVKDFGDITSRSALTHSLQHLTIVGPLDLSCVSLDDPLDVTTALRRAFANLQNVFEAGMLKSLTLKVATDAKSSWIPGMSAGFKGPIDPWRKVWESAKETFRLTMTALGGAQLRVERLDIFGSLPRCSLAMDRVGPVLLKTRSIDFLEKTKRLTLSLSDYVPSEETIFGANAVQRFDHDCDGSDCGCQSDDEDLKARSICSFEHVQASIGAVRQLISSCPELERLELHFFRLESRANAPLESKRRELHFFNDVVPGLVLPSLSALTLRGIHCSESALLLLLVSNPTISNLTLDNVRIDPGQFEVIFGHIAGPDRDIYLSRLDLDDVSDNEAGTWHYDAPGEAKVPWSRDHFNGKRQGPSTLKLEGKALEKRIVRRVIRGRVLGSPQVMNQFRLRRLRFGPING